MNKISKFKIIRVLLALMMIGSFAFFIWGQSMLPAENTFNYEKVSEFKSKWVKLEKDGSEVPVEVPGTCEAEHGEWVTISTNLPDDQVNQWLCIRSMQQDMKIYVGGELREQYSTLDTQIFGKTSTMTYVFFPLYEGDAGQELSIEIMTKSNYAGYVSNIIAGDKSDIIQYLYGLYAPGAIVAALLLIMGIFVVLCSIFLHYTFKKKVDIVHLGNLLIIAASWLLVESKLRQFIFPNSTIAMLMGFLLIAILPYPFLTYVNTIQKHRYKKIYTAIAVATCINFIVVVALQVLNIKDFFETMTFTHIIIVVLIVSMATTIIIDIIKGYVREYREVAIGFAVLMLAGIFEIGLTYMVDAVSNGISLSIGLVILLGTAGLKSLRDVVNIEKEKQYAIATSDSKAKFLATMSHEIRTPINTIIGMNEMIMRENNDENVLEYSYNIKSASQMLLGLVNDVLDFSKIEAGKLQIVEGEYVLSDMINDVILGVEMRAKQKNLEFKVVVDENMPSVLYGDEIRIKQVIINILSNAIKYTEKGFITLTINGENTEKGFLLTASVKDTGIGIKKEDMKTLFDSFQRFELSKNRNIEGAGLGLNITRLLVNLMNGTIDVESEYGKGSCFTVRVPQKIVDSAPMGSLKQKHRIDNNAEKAKESLVIPDARILVVDDTKMNLFVVEKLLKRTQAKVDMVLSGNECFELTQKNKYDIILMDHMMPEPDGIQTLHMIKEDADNLNLDTPIIVLTANAIVGMKEMYLSEGFSDYLSKPVEVDKLEEMLARYLNK